MPRALLRLALAASLVLAACPACSSSDAAASTTCSTGTPYTDDTVFPDGKPQTPEAKECIKRCGDTSTATWGASGGPSPTVSALPTGACEIAGEKCHLSAVRRFCPLSGNTQGVLLSFTCSCIGGQWSCAGVYEAGGAFVGCADGGS